MPVRILKCGGPLYHFQSPLDMLKRNLDDCTEIRVRTKTRR